MYIENNAVARRQHGNRVTDNGGSRIGRRRNGTDHTIGCVLGKRQDVIPGYGMRREHLRAGCFASNETILYHLVLDPPQAGFAMRVTGQLFGVLGHRLPNGSNNRLPSFQ